jgi:hypothetical protein
LSRAASTTGSTFAALLDHVVVAPKLVVRSST